MKSEPLTEEQKLKSKAAHQAEATGVIAQAGAAEVLPAPEDARKQTAREADDGAGVAGGAGAEAEDGTGAGVGSGAGTDDEASTELSHGKVIGLTDEEVRHGWELAVYPRGELDLFSPLIQSNISDLTRQFLRKMQWDEEGLQAAAINTTDLDQLLALNASWLSFIIRAIAYDHHLVKFVQLPFIDTRVMGRLDKSPKAAASVSTTVATYVAPHVGAGEALEPAATTTEQYSAMATMQQLALTTQPTITSKIPWHKGFAWPRAQALPFKSTHMLKRIYSIHAFVEGYEFMHQRFYGLLYASLVINQLYYYRNYPEFRVQHPLLILEILKLSKFYKLFEDRFKQAAFTDFFKSNCDTVDGQSEVDCSLANLIVLSLVIGIPVLCGVVKALLELRHIKKETAPMVEHIIHALKHNKPSVWRDTLPWFLPWSPMQEQLDAAINLLNWDGRITPEERTQVWHALRGYVQRAPLVSGLNGLYALASVADGVAVNDFQKCVAQGYTQEHLLSILKIKTEALKALRLRAQYPSSRQMLLQYLAANYLLWDLGRPNHKAWHLPFLPFKFAKTYLTIIALVDLGGGIIHAVVDKFYERKCIVKHGGEWKFIPQSKDKVCIVCPGWPVLWNQQLKEQKCTDGLLHKSRSFDLLFQNLNNRNFHLELVDSLDFQHQKFSDEQLAQVMAILSQRTKRSLKALSLSRTTQIQGLGPQGAAAIRDYLKLHKVTKLGLARMGIQPDTFGIIAESFSKTTIKDLDFSSNSLGYLWIQTLITDFPATLHMLNLGYNSLTNADLQVLLPKLQNSKLTTLDLEGNSLGDLWIQTLTMDFPATLQELYLSLISLTDAGLQVLMPKLQNTKLTNLDLSSNSLGDLWIQTLTTDFPATLRVLKLGNTNLSDAGLEVLMPKLQRTQLTKLDLSYNLLGDLGMQALTTDFPATLQWLGLSYNNFTDAGLKMLMPKLQNSHITTLVLYDNSLGDLWIQTLTTDFPATLQVLDLDNTGLIDVGLKALLPKLQKTQLTTLGLGYNFFKDLVPQVLTTDFPATLQVLDLGNTNLTGAGLGELLLKLQNTQLIELDLRDNTFDDLDHQTLTADFPATLQALDLSMTSLTSTGLQVLLSKLQNTQLTDLGLSGNSLGNDGAEAITTLLRPNCTKSFNLWIDVSLTKGSFVSISFEPTFSGFSSLDLSFNDIRDAGAKAVFKMLPYSLLSCDSLNFDGNYYISDSVLATCPSYVVPDHIDPKICANFDPILGTLTTTAFSDSPSADFVSPFDAPSAAASLQAPFPYHLLLSAYRTTSYAAIASTNSVRSMEMIPMMFVLAALAMLFSALGKVSQWSGSFFSAPKQKPTHKASEEKLGTLFLKLAESKLQIQTELENPDISRFKHLEYEDSLKLLAHYQTKRSFSADDVEALETQLKMVANNLALKELGFSAHQSSLRLS